MIAARLTSSLISREGSGVVVMGRTLPTYCSRVYGHFTLTGRFLLCQMSRVMIWKHQAQQRGSALGMYRRLSADPWDPLS